MPRKRKYSDEEFGATIERLMADTGLTYRGLAAKTGLSAGYLNHLVHGNRPVPSKDVVVRLAGALGVEPEHFREYRLRVIADRLEEMPELVDRLYRKLADLAGSRPGLAGVRLRRTRACAGLLALARADGVAGRRGCAGRAERGRSCSAGRTRMGRRASRPDRQRRARRTLPASVMTVVRELRRSVAEVESFQPRGTIEIFDRSWTLMSPVVPCAAASAFVTTAARVASSRQSTRAVGERVRVQEDDTRRSRSRRGSAGPCACTSRRRVPSSRRTIARRRAGTAAASLAGRAVEGEHRLRRAARSEWRREIARVPRPRASSRARALAASVGVRPASSLASASRARSVSAATNVREGR